jgi:transposase
MTRYVGLDVSQKWTAICVVDDSGRRLWRGQCTSDPQQIERTVRRHGGEDARIGIETGPMTPWLVHELRGRGLAVTCLDARHARAVLKMQINKTDQNDAEGLAQIMRTGWYRSVHVKSFDSHRARALLGARLQLVGMTTRLSNHIRGVLKTFGLLPGPMRGLPFDRRVEALLADRDDVAPIIRPMLAAWATAAPADRHLRQSGTETGEVEPRVPPPNGRAWDRRALCARLCQHDRRSDTLRPVTIRRCTPRANTKTISVGRDRPQRQNIEMRRHACPDADV